MDNIWSSAYCTYLKVKDSDAIVGFGLNNCFQLGIEDAENRYQPEIIQSMNLVGKVKKVVGGMHHTLILNEEGEPVRSSFHLWSVQSRTCKLTMAAILLFKVTYMQWAHTDTDAWALAAR